MKKFFPCSISLAAMLCASLLFSCTSDIEMPSPPPPQSSSSALGSGSYCIYPGIAECYLPTSGVCPGGGELSDSCQFAASSSSSQTEVAGSSSSILDGQSSSSDDGQSSGTDIAQSSSDASPEYGYCVFEADRTCIGTASTHCPPGSTFSNECQFAASSSSSAPEGQSSSAQEYGSSSSGEQSPSSSSGESSSSESQAYTQFDGDSLIDQRDGKRYKYEVAGGRVWMRQNLNYSRSNTIGYCYGVDIDGENPHRDSTSCGTTYGRAYSYETAMDGEPSLDKARGICPSGWHIPNATEWERRRTEGGVLITSAGNYDGTSTVLAWRNRGVLGFYWFSNAVVNSNAIGFVRQNYQVTATGNSTSPLANSKDLFSVRCVMNEDFQPTCGSQPLALAEQYCSGGVVHPLGMCGSNTYNPEIQFCSGTTTYAKCGGSDYDPATESCCGSSKYTTETEFCSSAAIYPKCGGTITYNPETYFCSGTTTYAKCGGSNYDPATEFCSSATIYAKCGGTITYNPETYFCSGTTTYAKCGGSNYNPSTEFCSSATIYAKCGGTATYNTLFQECVSNSVVEKENVFLDTRDGEFYVKVTISTQVWMSKNLNYATTEGSVCYNSNCDTYGRLYTQTVASTACPLGWHLPSQTELTTLTNGKTGNSLKATSGWATGGNGTDNYGFAALPGGNYYSTFQSVGGNGNWWSSNNGLYLDIDYNGNIFINTGSTEYFRSVRCLQNN
jgi:uncharacterized protein (TIGR02145 family)